MRKNKSNVQFLVPRALVLALGLSLAWLPVWAEETEHQQKVEPVSEVVTGVQGSSVDAQDDRRGGFDKYRDVPNGFVVDVLRYATTFDDDGCYLDLKAEDILQDDEQYLFKAGIGQDWRFRVDYYEVPYVLGNKAVMVVGRDSFRIGDFIQNEMEDPDGNGVPFYTSSAETAGDNALVRGMTNDLLTGTTPFDVQNKRRAGDIDVAWTPSSSWAFGLTYNEINKRGNQPLGNGTYQRITDVNGDGMTDYDYFFSIRGTELAAPIDYNTQQTGISANYRSGNWFGGLHFIGSDFENDDPFVLYDNPFWFTDTESTSGSRRGLWEESRVSQAPSNDAWNLVLNGGVAFAGRSNLTLTIASGEMNQDEPFAPITTNTSLVGTKDLNGDGVVDGRDNPLTVGTLPRSALNSSADTDMLGLNFSSRPNDWLGVKAFYKSYEFDESSSSSILIPARAEYNDSRLKTDMKGADLTHIPYYFERTTYGLEGLFDLAKSLKLSIGYDVNGWDWNRYQDLDPNGSFTRDVGNRSVSGTDDDTLALRLLWTGSGSVSGWLKWFSSDRKIDGMHQVAFAGQHEDLRQYDLANRERDGWELELDFYPWDTGSISFNLRDYEDDFVDSEYGLQKASENGATVSLSYTATQTSTFFIWGDITEYDADMHLRTKCSNCAPPPGAEWTAPWDVPNYDWFPQYTDETVSFGGGYEYRSDGGVNKFAVEVNYLDGQVRQQNMNPGVPRDLGQPGAPIAGVALAVDFPDQESTLTELDLRYTRKVSPLMSVGVAYLYEDWSLDDFQVENMQPYGANFLSVDDATRYLFLDSWYADYEANVGQVFLVIHLD